MNIMTKKIPKKKIKKKTGAIGKNEVDFIRENYQSMEPEEIASFLNRTVKFVKERIAQIPVVQEIEDRGDAVAQLHSSHLWPEIRRSLLTSEVRFFEQQWAKLIDQFSTNEILATDEMMIKDLVMLELSGLRATAEKKKVLLMMQDCESRLDRERKKPMDQRDMGLTAMLKDELTSLRVCLPQLSKEQLDFQQRKDQKLRDLKATREQRYKQIEESKKNVFELIKTLDEFKKRKQEGRWMELMKMGADKIENDWNDIIEFEDGTYNRPMLTPEAILKEDEYDKSELKGLVDESEEGDIDGRE